MHPSTHSLGCTSAFRSFDWNDARTFFDHHNLACCNALEALLQTTRPMNLEIDRCF